jgi:RNA polymerase sigma-70 factor (ECF subfamily)
MASDADPSVTTSAHLLRLAQQGDDAALDRLLTRYAPRLRRWAAGRLPRWARDVADTNDLVQESLLRTFKRIETIDAERSGGFQAYLRQAVMNGIRDELRRAHRRPAADALDSGHPSDTPSPLEAAIGREATDRYERALAALAPPEREAVVARLELGFDYQELAELLDKPSANAARMTVQRALVKLAERMRRER